MNDTFAAAVRRSREERKWTQGQLAAKVGKARSTVSKWETKGHVPSAADVKRLAVVLRKPVEYFLSSTTNNSTHLVRMMGRIAGGGYFAPVDGGLVDMGLFAELAQATRCFAVEVADDTMSPAYRHGDILLIEEEVRPANEGVGRDVLALLDDESQLLRRLAPGGSAGQYALVAYNGPTVHANVNGVRLVLGRQLTRS